MVARMNACLLHVKMRMLLHGDRLLSIVSCNIFENLCLTQWIALTDLAYLNYIHHTPYLTNFICFTYIDY